MKLVSDNRTESAIYWAAVGLIVCDRLSIEQAANYLRLESNYLREVLLRRHGATPYVPSTYAPTRPIRDTSLETNGLTRHELSQA
jgi:hypothetical protein